MIKDRMMKTIQAAGNEHIEKVESITEKEFEQNYFSKQKPVIIVGGINQWEAISLWSPDYFKSLYFNKDVTIHIFDEDKLPKRTQIFKMQDAIDLICNNTSEEKYYLSQHSIYDEFKELLNDIALPTWANKDKAYTNNLWFGQAGNATILHFDVSHNFLAQVSGRKYIRLFPPNDAPYLYPFSPESKKNTHYSQILDIDNPDLMQFPNFIHAKAIQGIISSGDVLFIPSGWWHDVRSLDTAISVNFWWKPKPEECVMSHVLRHLAWYLYDNDSFSDIRNHNIDLIEYPTDSDVAKYLIEKNYKWLAILFIWNFFENQILPLAEKHNISVKNYKSNEFEVINNILSNINNNLSFDNERLKSALATVQLARDQNDCIISDYMIQNLLQLHNAV